MQERLLALFFQKNFNSASNLFVYLDSDIHGALENLIGAITLKWEWFRRITKRSKFKWEKQSHTGATQLPENIDSRLIWSLVLSQIMAVKKVTLHVTNHKC